MGTTEPGAMLEKLRPKLQEFGQRRVELQAQVEDPEIAQDPKRYVPVARELGGLRRMLAPYDELLEVEPQLADAEEMALDDADAEMQALALDEVATLRARRDALVERLVQDLVLADDISERNAMLEIRAGTGGDEATLFAVDLLKMYLKWCEVRGLKTEIIEQVETEVGGFREVVVRIEGDAVYRDFRYESGTHRVQRVPATESQGRVHTSACTVAVMPEAQQMDLDIDEADIKKDVMRASGAGGQHVNRTESAVRLTHMPTGIMVVCQDERSQHKNYARALDILRTRLFDLQQRERAAVRAAVRKDQVGTGDRSEKIRTYNWPQDRVTDHRIGKNYTLSTVIVGELKPLIDDLQAADLQQRIDALGA